MYQDFFDPQKKPFGSNTDKDFYFHSASHRQALAALKHGIRGRCGLILLIGVIGTGKSSTCQRIEDQEDWRTVYLSNPHLTELEFLEKINLDLGIPVRSRSTLDLMEELHAHLIRMHRDEKPVVLFIDEAQLLSRSLLERILILSNLKLHDTQLLQIVLIGQPELLERIGQRELAALGQRICIRHHLKGMGRADTIRYIGHRLKKAGFMASSLFTKQALDTIWKSSQGTPRLINQICQRALTRSYRSGKNKVSRRVVTQALQDPLYADVNYARGARVAWRSALKYILVGSTVALGVLVVGVAVYEEGRIDKAQTFGIPADSLQRYEGSFETDSAIRRSTEMENSDSGKLSGTVGAESTVTASSALIPFQPGSEKENAPVIGELYRTEPARGSDKLGLVDQPVAAETDTTSTLEDGRTDSRPEDLVEGALPGLDLNAIAWDEDPSRSMVVLNEHILHEGDFLGGIRVLRIHPNYVVLLRNNEHVIMRMHFEE
jgi:type II secretory pathway predicted ATPase ExeA